MKSKPLVAAAMAAALAACGLPAQAPAPETDAGGVPADAQGYPADGNTFRLLAVEELPIVGAKADGEMAGNGAARAIDGDQATAWINGGYRNATSWAAVQLAGSATLASVSLKTGASPAGTGYDVQVSADGVTWKTVLANQTNSTWNLETKRLPAGTTGKHVRIFWRNSSTSPQAHFAIYEVLVNGEAGPTPVNTPTPAPTTAPSTAPTAVPSSGGTLSKVAAVSASASSTYSGLPASRVIDGDQTTQWASAGYKAAEESLAFDFGVVRTFGQVRLKTGALPEGITFKFDVSRDGVSWEPASGRLTNRTWGLEAQDIYGAGRYLRVRFFNSSTDPIARFSVYELEAYAASGTAPAPTASPTMAPSATPSGGTGVEAWYPDWIAVATHSHFLSEESGRLKLRFSTALANIGAGHIQVIPNGPNGRAVQEILDGSNRVIFRKETTRPVYFDAHGHTHVENIARYDFRQGSLTGPVLKTSVKTSFCVEDSYKYRSTSETARYPDCTPSIMGVTRNYADLYSANLPGQDFDITGLPAGEYYVVVLIDPGQAFLDASRSNNVAWTKFYLDPSRKTVTKLASSP